MSIGFSNKNTGVGCQTLLQWLFLTQGSNPHLLHLLHWQMGSLPLAPPNLKWKPTWNIHLGTYNRYFLYTKAVQNRLWDSVGESEGGMFWENSIETSILSRVKQTTSPDWMHETSAQGWCTGKTQGDGMGRRQEGRSGWGIHVNPWLIHVNVWQNHYNIVK